VQILILSDLHANWHALSAVLEAAAGRYERIVCCGDIVGYNAQPASVLEWTRANCARVIRGNHDKVVAGLAGLEWFNEIAQTAARWTTGVLSDDQLQYLRDLDEGPVKMDGFEMWHGSPADEDEYVTSATEAGQLFSAVEANVGFFGHSHVQGGFVLRHGRVAYLPQVRRKDKEYVLELDREAAYMINPGSVGQPRDRDPRAAYAFYDPERALVTFCRIDYPIQKTVEEIQQAGLPETLGLRLLVGV
jgi:predicted phosphodiesterase